MGLNKGYLTAKTDKASDEVYTPDYAIKPILKYINDKKYTIWCPFDTEENEYVHCLRAAGHTVIVSHIDTGKNFFYYEPEEDYDYIISNPPFSVKDDILKRLYELNKPYAMLMPLPTLQGIKRFPYIKNCQILILIGVLIFIKIWKRKLFKKGLVLQLFTYVKTFYLKI